MKVQEKQEARTLRRDGWSVKEIAKALHVAVGSVSVWVSDIALTEEQVRRLEEKQRKSRAYLLGRAEQLRRAAAQAHEAYRREGRERAGSDEAFRLICALYWGEGGKSERNRYFAISNSDHRLLNVVFQWLLASGYGPRVSFRVQYHQDNGLTKEEITAWWMKNLPGLEQDHLRKFSTAVVNRASQRKKQGKLPFGTAVLQVCSVRLYYNVMGGIDFLAQPGT
jgi:hypothetical protein